MRKLPETAIEGMLFLLALDSLSNRESLDETYDRISNFPLLGLGTETPRASFQEQLEKDKRKENGQLMLWRKNSMLIRQIIS